MNLILRLLPLLILFLLSTALALGLFGTKPINPIDDLHYGLTFPDYQLPTLKSDEIFSPKLFGNGQVVVVSVFASWCGPCAEEHPLLMQLAHKVNMYGVAWKDKPDNVFNYLKEKGNPFQKIGIDENGITTMPMAISGVPELYVLNKKGQIAFHFKAPLTEQLLNLGIIPMIEKLNREKYMAP